MKRERKEKEREKVKERTEYKTDRNEGGLTLKEGQIETKRKGDK